MLTIGGVEQIPRAFGAYDRGRVMTGGMAPRSTSSSAVRTLMELTMATAVIVEPGPTGVSRPSMVMSASAWRGAQVDDEVGLVEEAAADRRVEARSDIDCATEVTAMTRSPRRRAPRAISTGTAVVPPAEKTISTSCGPNAKLTG